MGAAQGGHGHVERGRAGSHARWYSRQGCRRSLLALYRQADDRSRDAVLQGLAQACKENLIGIGLGLSPDKLQRKWCGQDVTVALGEEGVWIIRRSSRSRK